MKTAFVVCVGIALWGIRAETETIDLTALAKNARPAVLLLVVSDAAGKELAIGTGFLVSNDGKLITNHHLIENAASAVARTENGDAFPILGVLADDPKNDLVLLKLKSPELPFLKLRTVPKIEIGTPIAVVGSSLGSDGTVAEGTVAAIQELHAGAKLWQVTAAFAPGSSGAPVLAANGEVVAVAATFAREGQTKHFVVPVEFVRELLKLAAEPVAFGVSPASSQDAVFFDPGYRAVVGDRLAEDFAQMLKHAKELVSRHPTSAVANDYLSSAYLRLKRFDEAIASARAATRLKPADAAAWFYLGVVSYEGGRKLDAIAAYRQATKLNADYSDAWYCLGVTYGESGLRNDAMAALREAIRIKPDLAAAWYCLGVIDGCSAEAIAAYNQAIKLDPHYPDPWNNLGTCYAESGRTAEAIVAFETAVKIKPDLAIAWNNLGVAYNDSRRLADAIAAFRQATELNPDYAHAWWNLGKAYRKAGQGKESAAALQRAKQLKPDLFK